MSRFDETPAEMVIDLQDGEYHTVGAKADVTQSDRLQAIETIISDRETGMTAEEVEGAWQNNGIPKPSRRTIRADLNAGFDATRWKRSGKGKRGDPHRFQFDSGKSPPLIPESNQNQQPGAGAGSPATSPAPDHGEGA